MTPARGRSPRDRLEARSRWSAFADSVWQVVRQALRSLRRTPGLSLTVIVVFALGIGANATMIETLDRLLFSAPPHVQEPDVVKRIYLDWRSGASQERLTTDAMPYPDFEDFREMAGFEAVAAFRDQELTVGRGDRAERLSALMVTHEYWRVLGARPALGRFFDSTEDAAGAAPVAVIGHRLWQERFGGASTVLGETLDFGYGPYTIIGVAPRGLTTLDLGPVDILLPLEVAGRDIGGTGWVANRGFYYGRVVARLADDAQPAAVEAELTARHRQGREEQIAAGGYDPEARAFLGSVIWSRGPNIGEDIRVAVWLGGVALVVLLIAALNVANLLLARSVRNRRETAIRLAMGASTTRLGGQMVAEGALLGLFGAAAALLVDRWGGLFIRTTLFPTVAWADLEPSMRLWAAVSLASVGVGILSALPVLAGRDRQSVTKGLQGGGGGTPRGTVRFRAGLSMLQASFSVVLLVGAGLFLRSLDTVRAQELGFATNDLYEVRLVTDPGSVSPPERQELLLAAAERVRRLPGVEGAAVALNNPLRSFTSVSLLIPGVEEIPRAATGGPFVNAVGEGYFQTLGIRIVEGRGFEPPDHRTGARVAVVGEAMARRVWPGDSALGRCIQVGGSDFPCSTVIGVAADPRQIGILEDEETFLYWLPIESLGTDTLRPGTLVVRLSGAGALGIVPRIPRRTASPFVTSVSGAGAIGIVHRELVGLDPRIRFVQVADFRDTLGWHMRSWTLGATLFTAFGALALLIAALGLYSVIAFDVTQRTREIGIRTALGATARRVVRTVLLRAVGLAGAGVVIGLAAAALLAPRIEDLLYGVGAHDGATFATVAVVLLFVAVVAAGMPARRAARVDPMTALRAE